MMGNRAAAASDDGRNGRLHGLGWRGNLGGTLVGSLITLALVAALGGEADAAGRQHKKRHQATHAPTAASHRRPASGDGEAPYYEHLLGKVPFGSKRWWSIYEEQHGTPD
jgi:hypothetical protein